MATKSIVRPCTQVLQRVKGLCHQREHMARHMVPLLSTQKPRHVHISLAVTDEGIILKHKDMIKTYTGILNCDEQVVVGLVLKDTRLVTGPTDRVMSVMRSALSYGYGGEEICASACWFHRRTDMVERRLEEMHRYKIWCLNALCRPEHKYQALIKLHEGSEQIPSTRLETLAALLECSTDEGRGLMRRCHALSRKPLYLLVAYVDLLKQHGFTSGYIRDDPAILAKNLPDAIERMRAMDAANFRHFGEYGKNFLGYQRGLFDRAMENYREDSAALGGSEDVVQYISHRLACTRGEALVLYRRVAGLRNRPCKVKAMLDVLLDEGGIAGDVVRWKSSLFNYSVERHRRRIGALRRLGIDDGEEAATSLLMTDEQFRRRHLSDIVAVEMVAAARA